MRPLFLPPGVSHCPHNTSRPWQARIQWRGRRLSLGYFRSIAEAEGRVNAMRAAIRQWEASLPPPPQLLPYLQSQPEP